MRKFCWGLSCDFRRWMRSVVSVSFCQNRIQTERERTSDGYVEATGHVEWSCENAVTTTTMQWNCTHVYTTQFFPRGVPNRICLDQISVYRSATTHIRVNIYRVLIAHWCRDCQDAAAVNWVHHYRANSSALAQPICDMSVANSTAVLCSLAEILGRSWSAVRKTGRDAVLFQPFVHQSNSRTFPVSLTCKNPDQRSLWNMEKESSWA